MILNPAILALLTASGLATLILLRAGWYGVRILARWDLASGSELQLDLEKRTYLIATIVRYACFFQIVALFFYIGTADNLHTLFSGAMCAAGVLNLNRFGYPVLLLKMAVVLLAGLWLIVDHADVKGYDYPLIRPKYAILLLLAPLAFLDALLQVRYFLGLKADVITSCCGSQFSLEGAGISAELAGLPARPMMGALFGSSLLLVVTGIVLLRTGRGARLFSFLGTGFLAVALAAVISFVCLYFYELPTHHCPFCLLQREYGHVGYLLYASLLAGGVASLGIGFLAPFRGRGSMARVIPPLLRRLTVVALGSYLTFLLVTVGRMLTTSFRLD